MLVLVLVLVLVLGCAPPAPHCPDTTTAPRGLDTSKQFIIAPPSSSPPALPDLEISLKPSPVPSPHVDVELTARAAPDALTTWHFARAPQLSTGPSAIDDSGPIPVTLTARDGAAQLTLGRPANGAVKVRYTSKAEAPSWPVLPSIAVDPDRFDASTDVLVAIPSPFRDRDIRVRLTIDLRKVSTAELSDGASSLGVGGVREATVRGRDLQDAHVVGGLMGKARLEAPEGHDEAAWLGYTAFDPRPAIADLAGFRTAARQIFGDLAHPRLVVLLVTDARPVGAFTASRRGQSISLRVGMGEPWSAPVRIAMAAEVLHEWIGPRLWIGPSEPAREAEAYWFTEGVTRALARDLLFRFGLLTTAELASEMEGLAGLVATSPVRDADNAALAKLPKGALPLLVARGALYATRVDALLRERSKAQRSIAHVLRELYIQAGKTRGPLSTEAWIAAVSKDLGEGERGSFRDAVELGKPFEMPEGALGPCFRRITRTYAAYDPGFDVEASRANKSAVGVVSKGPADRAGLRDGDAIVGLSITAGRSDVLARIVVERAGAKKPIEYRPAGATGKGTGWERKTALPEAVCAR